MTDISYSIQPTVITRLTGELGSATKIYRGIQWRAEYTLGQAPKLFRNSLAWPVADAPAVIRQFVVAAAAMFLRAEAEGQRP